MLPSYRKHSVELQSKLTDWFLHDGSIGRSRVKVKLLSAHIDCPSHSLNAPHICIFSEVVSQSCPVKNALVKISQNSYKNICARVSFLIELQAPSLRPVFLFIKRLWHRCFPRNFDRFLRKPFL